MKILIVEDDKDLGESLLAYLRQDGYTCERAENFMIADDKLSLGLYDVVLIDITIPGGSGLDLIHTIKSHRPETGILIISAKNSLDDKLKGLDLGGDDYLTKPFHLAELNARIKALIRRRSFDGKNEIEYHEIKIDPALAAVTVNRRTVELTKKEFDLLLFFINNKNRVLTKEAIAMHLWGDSTDGDFSYDFIYTHIKNLRKKLADKGCTDYLKSIYGMGYKFSDK
ncbi:MAG: response regulator transcription factor [Bacteroidetes bacterium]|nr:response regulator transcription factor [Bacteroidota bacterium]MBS1686843.1 response regulator transcription factor [Bacteroidota bacterium]